MMRVIGISMRKQYPNLIKKPEDESLAVRLFFDLVICLSLVTKTNPVMSKKVKALLYNFIGFALLFLPLYYLVGQYTNRTGFWIPVIAFVISTLIAPKFQAVQTKDGEKLFVKWLFLKGVKEIK
jgi:hypothetical protein